jgi:4-aminobutyrate aminotransferase/(S)-3-amino-2-methylpropionate transaminase
LEKQPAGAAPLPGGLGGTYAGNPLACAAALAVLDVFERDRIVARAERVGSQLGQGLERLKERHMAIGDVRGLGCMLAIEIVRDRDSREPDADLANAIVERARERGLLVLRCGPAKNVVRFLPPLTSSDDEIARGLAILSAALG